MQFLALEKELRPIDSQVHAEVLLEEASTVWALKKQSVLRDIWFTARDRRAILMLEAANEEEAHRILAGLPLVRDGFIAFEVLELRAYDGFDRLLAASKPTP